MRDLLLSLSFFWLISGCSSTSAIGVSKNSGHPYLGKYQPERLESVDDLPAEVRSRLLTHLTNRLGEPFFDELKFIGGRHVDHASLYTAEPMAVNYKWEVPAYALDFEFNAPEVGIDRYIAQVLLRGDGSIIREIDIPAISSSPEKLHIIPLTEALLIASKSASAPKSPLSAEITYDADMDAFVWRISYTTSQDRSSFEFTRIDIAAHSGSIIRTFDGVGDF